MLVKTMKDKKSQQSLLPYAKIIGMAIFFAFIVLLIMVIVKKSKLFVLT
jgi:hypothetical protein